MKKVVSLLLALSIVFSMAVMATATEIQSNEFAAAEMPSDGRPMDELFPVSARKEARDLPKDFGGLTKNSYCYITESRVVPGVTELRINDCSWLPTIGIEIGFYNSETGRRYGVVFNTGTIHNFTITTENIPAGTYWCYVRNNGNSSISSGTLFYNLIN